MDVTDVTEITVGKPQADKRETQVIPDSKTKDNYKTPKTRGPSNSSKIPERLTKEPVVTPTVLRELESHCVQPRYKNREPSTDRKDQNLKGQSQPGKPEQKDKYTTMEKPKYWNIESCLHIGQLASNIKNCMFEGKLKLEGNKTQEDSFKRVLKLIVNERNQLAHPDIKQMNMAEFNDFIEKINLTKEDRELLKELFKTWVDNGRPSCDDLIRESTIRDGSRRPVGGGADPPRGAPTYDIAKFSKKSPP